MPIEPNGQNLRHCLLFGHAACREQLQLHAGRKGRYDGLDVFRQQAVDRDVCSSDVSLRRCRHISEQFFLEIGGNQHDGHDRPFAHHSFALGHRLRGIGDIGGRCRIDHLDQLSRKCRMVVIDHGDRNVAGYSLAEKQGEKTECDQRQIEQQHPIHPQIGDSTDFTTGRGGRMMQEPDHRRRAFFGGRSILSQSTKTLMPGRNSFSDTGFAFTAKVRMSNPPCVRVADHVAKSAWAEI